MKSKKRFGCLIYFFAALVIGIVFAVWLRGIGAFPREANTDTFGHLFKINYLYESIKDGVLYPIYTEYWYNSMELFRYWPPLSYYVVVLFQFLTDGDVYNAFYIFVGFVYVLNMAGWFLFGKREERLGIAFLVGNLFFFCPDNLRVLFAEGNIPRIFITSMLPFAFYFVWEVIHHHKNKALIGLAVTTILITFSHYMIAAMMGISIFLFCLVYGLAHRSWKREALVIVDLVGAYLASGISLIPGLTGGGLTSQSSEASVQTISQWAQEATRSLNPLLRFDVTELFYFGLVIFLMIVLGMITANKETVPGFVTAFVIFVCTTTSVSTVVRLLPMSQVFWMTRFVPMAMCTFFLSIFLWRKLKKTVIIVLTIALIVDVLPTTLLIGRQCGDPVGEYVRKDMDQYLMDEAMAITRNRLGILDNSLWGAIPSYYLSRDMDENSVQYSYGWAFQGAETMNNIVSINEAAQMEHYTYSFDRMLELGDDTVLVYKELVPGENVDALKRAAAVVGYELVQENDKVWLYHIDVQGTFGVKKQYENIAIGQHARAICYIYPQFAYGNSSVIEDYTVEELSKYDKIYLSGFTYRDKLSAESMLKEVADAGTKIYIDMQHIPMNELTGKAEFMDVYAQYVAFTERFPIIETDNGSQFKLDFKTAGYSRWNTVYISGMEESIKTSFYDDHTHLTYLGRNGHENIVFMGFNTVYYYLESGEPKLLTFLGEVFEEEPESVCETELVPIEVDYEADRLTITAPEAGIITGVANLQCFERQDGNVKKSYDNVLLSDVGTTVYDVKYSDLKIGLICSVVGIVVLGVLWCVVFKKKEGMTNEEN